LAPPRLRTDRRSTDSDLDRTPATSTSTEHRRHIFLLVAPR
jgi:hypothetical protein